MDKKLVASKQTYEIYYISYRFEIPLVDVKLAIYNAKSRSRKKVYAELRKMGYSITTKAFR